MKRRRAPSGSLLQTRAFTRLELAVVIAVLAVGVMLFLPAYVRSKAKSNRIYCTTNLKQVALAFRMFAGDNDGLYPFRAHKNPAFGDERETWKHFLAMSNELSSAGPLICPYDYRRLPFRVSSFFDTNASGTNDFIQRQNLAVSYFVGLTASETNAQSIVVGDRSIAVAERRSLGPVLTLRPGEQFQWGNTLHLNTGNYALADGSVIQSPSGHVPPAGGFSSGDQRLLLPLFPLPTNGTNKTN